jgi:sigma-B regulation protein RsbU (phosphoserine phosphatase)
MTTARAFLRALVQQGMRPAAVLSRMNDLLVTDMTDGRFMTMFYGVLQPEQRTMFYSSAGHEPPLLVRPRTGTFEEFTTGGCPLGILQKLSYPMAEIRVGMGDILVISTDGIQESMDKAHAKFGRERLANVITKHASLDAATIIRKVHDAVRAFSEKLPQRDDLTLVIAKCTG